MEAKQLHFEDRASWRAWLGEHHESEREIWMVFFKKHTGLPNISYNDAVEEALCFGWIDSLIKKLDDDRYARKFTPRTNTAKWSELNIKRVEKLKAAGRMTPAGLAKIDASVKPAQSPSRRSLELPTYFRDALAGNETARLFFEQLAPSYRRNFIAWVHSAKRETTRRRRLAEALKLLENRQKLGMK